MPRGNGNNKVEAKAPPAKRRKPVKGLNIPLTLKEANAANLADADVNDKKFKEMLQRSPVALSDTVPVGHFWRLGWVKGGQAYACYRTDTDQCDWKLVDENNIPDWDPG